MSGVATVQIIGVPVVCSEGYKGSWREVAEWASEQLKTLYGDSVEVAYFDLFDPACPALPSNAQLPLAMINNQVVINGGKISIPLIRKSLLAMGVEMKSKSYV